MHIHCRGRDLVMPEPVLDVAFDIGAARVDGHDCCCQIFGKGAYQPTSNEDMAAQAGKID